MKSLFQRMFPNALTSRDSFRVKLFNFLLLIGFICALGMALYSFILNAWENLLLTFCFLTVCVALFAFVQTTGRYQVAYTVVILLVFMTLFPFMFFSTGGYKSGMPVFFVLAIIFTVIMLDGLRAILVAVSEVLLYCVLCYTAYAVPDMITFKLTEQALLIDVLASLISVSFAAGSVVYLHIRDFKIQQDHLERQNMTLKHYDEMKTSFLTTVAHEIKNPLAAISVHTRDSTELLQETPMDVEQIRENLEIVNQIVKRIDTILLDLMDTVSIEQGRLALTLAPVYMKNVIKAAAKSYFDEENVNKNALVLDIDESLPKISVDQARLMQVFNNLLSNAVRHTKGGTITIRLQGHSKGQLVVVEDTGSGMPKYILDNAMTGYVSASKDYWRHGIGLYICKQIVTAHGGEIWIESEAEKGTKIFFVLPKK